MASILQNQALADQADSYAFLPVWPRITIQLVVIGAVVLLIVLVSELLQPPVGKEFGRLLSMALVAFPVVLWLFVSVWPEFRVARPRRFLIGVAVVSGLAASAVGLPLVQDFFQVDLWLPLQSVFQRIIGFTLTAGVIDMGLKFVVLRYLIYPQGLRVRGDAIAYAHASAVGYSFFLNLALIWSLEPTWDLAAIYVLSNFTIQFASSMFIALGLIESYFSDAFMLVLPLNLVAAALTTGLLTPLISGLMSGPLGTAGATDRPLFGVGFLLAALVAALGAVYFLYSNSERREREAYVGHGDVDGI